MHKHSILCAVLDGLRRRSRALTYMETHAGRGLYDLHAAEAAKTGEAATGWLAAIKTPEKLPPQLVEIVRGLNDGKDEPLYPGSPLIAARLLRPQDKLHLMELHPQEHKALCAVFEGDERVVVEKKDGYEGVLALCPPAPRSGLVLVDPSYEIKDEYLGAAAFVDRLRNRWPEATVMLWYPLLPAARHEAMLEKMRLMAEVTYNEYRWAEAGDNSGMYGSGIVLFNYPAGLAGFTQI